MKQDNFAFSPKEAKTYGCEEAIMIHHFRWWIQKNIANEKHFHEKRTWTYNSKKAMMIIFSFWTEKQLRRIIDSMVEQKIIIKGNFNKTTFDKTTWYSFCDEKLMLGTDFTEYCPNGQAVDAQMGILDSPNGQMDNSNTATPLAQKGRPIPDIIPDKETDNKKNSKEKKETIFFTSIDTDNLTDKEKRESKEKKIYQNGSVIELWSDWFDSIEDKNQYAYAIDFFVDDDEYFYDNQLFQMFKSPVTEKKYLGTNPKYQNLTLKFLSEEELSKKTFDELRAYIESAPECKLYHKYRNMIVLIKNRIEDEEAAELQRKYDSGEITDVPEN